MENGLLGIRNIEELDLENKRVFLRLDLNVPIHEGVITDNTRILKALPTIRYALDKKAKLVLASHLGRPKKKEDRSQFSLDPVGQMLSELLNLETELIEDPTSDAPKELLRGSWKEHLILLENLRFDKDETKNGPHLADAIASYTDVYVNDAFGASHRAHASIVGIPARIKNHGIGFLIKNEIEMLDKIRLAPIPPFLMILGGAKVSDKIGVINNLIDHVDTFLIGGAMAHTFLAASGVPIGKSLYEKAQLRLAKELIDRIQTRGKKILLPIDHVVTGQLKENPESEVTKNHVISENLMGVDIGPETIKLYSEEISKAGTVFWNGPMGVFEIKPFHHGTFKIAESVAACSGTTVVGGGDSVSAVNQSGLNDKMTHISTGGGASLEYLQGDPLPGLEVLRKK
jgi:phosphoglycerate kinase